MGSGAMVSTIGTTIGTERSDVTMVTKIGTERSDVTMVTKIGTERSDVTMVSRPTQSEAPIGAKQNRHKRRLSKSAESSRRLATIV
jgi:hypothetical protein